MVFCLNPDCQKPVNTDDVKFCITCGAKLTPELKGRYIITKALSRGGFGKTYLAVDKDRSNAICVIKQFAPAPEIARNSAGLTKAKELFEKEAQQLVSLGDHHLQIPTLYQYFEENKYFYLVQQYIEGKTLLEELEKEGVFNGSLGRMG